MKKSIPYLYPRQVIWVVCERDVWGEEDWDACQYRQQYKN